MNENRRNESRAEHRAGGEEEKNEQAEKALRFGGKESRKGTCMLVGRCFFERAYTSKRRGGITISNEHEHEHVRREGEACMYEREIFR